MTLSDYILDLGLIGLVFIQLRGRRLTVRDLLLPIVIVGVVANQYLKSIPTAGNDLLLIALCASIGIGLGAAAGLTTDVTNRDGTVFAKATAVAGVLWVLGIGFRLAFQEYATHGGAAAIARFSAQHSITTGNAWVAAFVLMALGEVVARTLVIAGRAHQIHPGFFSETRRPAIIGSR